MCWNVFNKEKDKILTLGETMAVFNTDRPGMLRYAKSFELRIAGAESNLAIGVSKLGHRASWISMLGEDEFGHFILNAVRAEGVETDSVRFTEDWRTGVMFKQTLAGRETSVFYYRENSAASHMNAKLWSDEIFSDAAILHLTGITPVLSESCNETCRLLIKRAKEAGVLLCFDPNIRKKLWKNKDYTEDIKELVLMADIVLIGLDEAKVLLKTETYTETVDFLLKYGSAKYIAVKDGANGAYVADRNEACRIPAYSCNCIDPIGAGDAFNAAFLCGILEDRSILDCGRMGAICGALATETFGDTEGYPTKSMLETILNREEVVYR